MAAIASTLLAVVAPQMLACGGGLEDATPEIVRLIPTKSQRILRPGTLGTLLDVLDGSLGAGAWEPMPTDRIWSIDRESLIIEPGSSPFDLERPLVLDAAALHTLEVTLASRYKVRLSLFWRRQGETGWGEHSLGLGYDEGRGDQQQKTFDFDLRSHSEWWGTIDRLRLRLEPARQDDRIVIKRLRGVRQILPPDVLSEQSLQSWRVELGREIRPGLLVPPKHPVERDVLAPEDSTLRFAVGTTGRLSVPITFRISAQRVSGESSLLFESLLEPVERAETRRWQEASVDLGAFVGERIRLRADSLVGDGFDATLGFPVWANPEIVPARTELPHPNIILISIDTLRADHLSLYGYKHSTSPLIDAWARRFAVVFQNAVAQAPWTLPSHSSMLTGLDALHHGVNHPFEAAPKELMTLAERLSEEGYFTAAITGGAWLHPEYGLADGYERYRYWIGDGRGEEEIEVQTPIATRWLDELREPFFFFLHTYDVHDFTVPRRRAPAASADAPLSLVQRYDHAVTHMDTWVGGFLERFGSGRLRGRTIVALTSDHGEDLGEDGVRGHGSLRDQVLLVPLVLELPDGRGAGKAIDVQVRSIDLVPTLLDMAGIDSPGGLDGLSLRSLIEEGPATGPPMATSYFSLEHGLSLRFRNRRKYLYNSSAWKPADGREALYHLPGGESRERDDRAPGHPQTKHFRAVARQLLDERLAGLQLRISNALPRPFKGTLQGQLIRVGVPKSTDLEGPWLKRVGEEAASFSVPSGQEFHLLFERVGEPELELVAETSDGEARHLVVDLETLTLPVTFRWTPTGWEREVMGASPVAGITIEWRRGGDFEGAPPFEQDPELRRHLEALGYLK